MTAAPSLTVTSPLGERCKITAPLNNPGIIVVNVPALQLQHGTLVKTGIPLPLTDRGPITVFNTDPNGNLVYLTNDPSFETNLVPLTPGSAISWPPSTVYAVSDNIAQASQVTVMEGAQFYTPGSVTISSSSPVDVFITNASIPITGTVAVSSISGSVSITGTVNVGTITSGSITFTNSNIAINNVVQTQGAIDVIANLGATSMPFSHNYTGLAKTYQAIMILVASAGGGANYYAQVQDSTLNTFLNGRAQPQNPAVGLPVEFLFPFGNNIGDTLTVNLTGPNASQLIILGITNAEYLDIREDGRPVPTNHLASSYATGASGTLIAAPGSGLRTMLSTLTLIGCSSSTAGSLEINVTATIGGSTVTLATTLTQTNNQIAPPVMKEWPNGLLVDYNTAVNVVVSGASVQAVRAEVTYDTVV